MPRADTVGSLSNSSEFVPDWVLAILKCPISGSPLVRFYRREWEADASRVRKNQYFHRDGRSVSEIPSQGLLSSDQKWLYPVNGGIVSLVADEAIVFD